MNDTDVQAINTDCKPKLHKNYKLVLQIWLVNNNVVPGSTKLLIQKHVALDKIRFCHVSISLTLYGYVWNGIQQFYSYYFCIITVCSIQIPRWSTTFAKIFTTILSNKAHITISQNAMRFTWPSIPIVMSELEVIATADVNIFLINYLIRHPKGGVFLYKLK